MTFWTCSDCTRFDASTIKLGDGRYVCWGCFVLPPPRCTRHGRSLFVCGCATPHSAAPHSTSPLFLHSPPNSQIPPKGPTQMREMSKGGVTPSGSNPAGVAPPTTENQTGHSTAPEQSAVPAHTEGLKKGTAEERITRALGFCGPLMWHRSEKCCAACDHNQGQLHLCAGCGMEGSGAPSPDCQVPAWSAGGGSVRAPVPCKAQYPHGPDRRCDRPLGHDGVHSNDEERGIGPISWPATGGGSVPQGTPFKCCAISPVREALGAGCCDLPLGHDGPHADEDFEWSSLPPVHRCPERVSAEGEAIENCDAVIGRDVQCFVCLGARCYVHCGCLQHHKGAKVVHRGGQGSFEWAVWEFEHAFRGQLYAKAADGSGLVILGTHGGASSDAVLTILLRSLERIQGRKVRDTRGQVIGQSAKARSTNEAAGELRADNDPEFELHELDAKVVLLLEQSKRLHSAADEAIQKARLGVLGACTDWLRATEHVWQDLAEDPEQNPRLVWQAKELHDQQVADLFFRLGALFNGGES